MVERLLLVATALLLGAQAPHRAEITSLSWMVGDWVAEGQEGWTEERWAPARGGAMLGTSLIGRGDRATAYEFMRLTRDDDGGISFWEAPSGQAATRFRLVNGSAREAVFENPANDYPTRIVYRREGARLMARISGPGGSNPQTWNYRRRR